MKCIRGTSRNDETPSNSTSCLAAVDTANSARVHNDGSNINVPNVLILSKNQQKRLLKRQYMLQRKEERKKLERERKRAQAEADGRDLEAERRFVLERTAAGHRQRRLQHQWDTEKLPLANAGFQICLDCSFESAMTEKEIARLAKQLRYCYSANKRSPHPCLWSATSLKGETLDHLLKETGYSEWKNRAYIGTEKPLEDYYAENLSNIVYLSSDSETVLDKLEANKIYVIGGIVDRNRLKRATIDRAQKVDIATAKLPLDQYIKEMSSTKILTCNHVFSILLKCREYENDWEKALKEVIPRRKEALFKTAVGTSGDESSTNGEE